MSSPKHDLFIAGQWVSGASYQPNVNPSNHEDVLGYYAQADLPLVETAVAAAHQAFDSWSVSGIQQRSDALAFIGAELIARQFELGALLAREEGKTRKEAIAEVVRAGQIFHFFAGECLRMTGDILPSVRPGVSVEVSREAVGVVGVITPWNFPIAIPAWKIAPALAYGNCVVFKPADVVPGSAWALAEIISRSGIPAGVFSLVMGSGRVVGECLVNHPNISAMTFTGSTGTGMQIAQKCAAQLKKVQLEMGGKNPQVVLDDADLRQAVELSVQSAFFSTGQRCTATSRFIVTEGIHDRYVAAMKERIAQLRVGDALADDTDIGPVASRSQLEQDLSYVQIGRDEGATLAIGGTLLERGTPGNYLAPALFTETHNQMRINREEIFGPVATVIRVKDYEEALAVANDTPFGLSAGIATTSLKYASHFKRHSQAGMVMVNVATAGVDYHVPFGGRKASSYGAREQGQYAKEFYTIVKTGRSQI